MDYGSMEHTSPVIRKEEYGTQSHTHNYLVENKFIQK